MFIASYSNNIKDHIPWSKGNSEMYSFKQFLCLIKIWFYTTIVHILLYILYLDIVGVLYTIPLKFLIDEFPWKRNAHTTMILVEWVQFYSHNSLLMRWKVLLNANILYRWLTKIVISQKKKILCWLERFSYWQIIIMLV